MRRRSNSEAKTSLDRSAQPKLRPVWQSEWRELRFGDVALRRFAHRAVSQELILAAFQEEHWPAAIDDPLPIRNGISPKRRLRNTVKNLNRGLGYKGIHFTVSPDGQSVRWKRVPAR